MHTTFSNLKDILLYNFFSCGCGSNYGSDYFYGDSYGGGFGYGYGYNSGDGFGNGFYNDSCFGNGIGSSPNCGFGDGEDYDRVEDDCLIFEEK